VSLLRSSAALLVVGCSNPTPNTGPVPMYDAHGEFFDAPWPSDTRVDDDGTTASADFPNPSGNPLLGQYIALADAEVGFGANSPVFLRFETDIDTAALPDPAASIEPGSPLFLLDVDPGSPTFAQPVPIDWTWQATETHYQPERLLAVAPLWGFPLRPKTTYALVVTTELAAPAPGFADVWDEDHPDHDLYDGLAEALFLRRLGKEDVAVATVFTVGDPLGEMARIAAFLRDAVTPPALDQNVDLLRDNAYFHLYEGRYLGPLFAHGQRPYTTEGGGFRWGENGQPLIYEWEDMRLSVTVPLDLTKEPARGWPVVIHQHGTGGDFLSHASTNSATEPCAQFAMAGMVGLGIEQPLHGTRGETPNSDLLSFNYFNPESGRTNFRQGAIDAMYLAQMVHTHGGVFETPEGAQIRIDPDKIYFMGHSQGGLTGALAIPFLGPYVDAAVLSGAGGGLSITLVERKDPLDIAELLAATLDFDEDEVVAEHHPAVSLIQWLVDVTDPINYAPYWFAERGDWEQEPVSVLLFSGLEDSATPHHTAEALAAAGRLTWLAPGVTETDAQALRGLDALAGPFGANAPAFDGAATAAFSQWEAPADHFVIFDDGNAARIYREFLRTAAEGEAVVDRYP